MCQLASHCLSSICLFLSFLYFLRVFVHRIISSVLRHILISSFLVLFPILLLFEGFPLLPKVFLFNMYLFFLIRISLSIFLDFCSSTKNRFHISLLCSRYSPIILLLSLLSPGFLNIPHSSLVLILYC